MLLQIWLYELPDLGWLNRIHPPSLLSDFSDYRLPGQSHPFLVPIVENNRMCSGFFDQFVSMFDEIDIGSFSNLTDLCIFWSASHCFPFG
jgi:hypothetical protein